LSKRLLIVIYICLILSVVFLLYPESLMAEEGEKKQALKHIFIISVAGLNYEGFVSAPTPNIQSIAAEGVIDEKSMAIKTNTIEAAEASLLSGAFPDEHKYLKAGDKIEVDLLVNLFNKNNKSIVIVDGSGGKLKSFSTDEKKYICLKSSVTDKEVLNQALKYFGNNKPFFTYIYLDDCIQSLISLNEKAYYSTIKSFDNCLGGLIDKLRKEKLYYNSLIIITSPRSSSPSNLVPLIIHGPMCRSNARINNTMVIDAASTICKLTGSGNLFNSRGMPIYDALLVPDTDREYVLDRWVNELKKERISTWSKYFKLQDEFEKNAREMASIKKEKEDIFDFIGEKDETITRLKSRISVERLLYLGLFFLMLIGYLIQYRLLKRKFLLFS